ncbi:MAG: Txe/YoeB family addiction module toxin [Bacillota bacterium]
MSGLAQDRKTALEICKLIEEIIPSPFEGSGKPELLKYALAGCWSRRITGEHRIVYLVQNERIDFLQSRYHY